NLDSIPRDSPDLPVAAYGSSPVGRLELLPERRRQGPGSALRDILVDEQGSVGQGDKRDVVAVEGGCVCGGHRVPGALAVDAVDADLPKRGEKRDPLVRLERRLRIERRGFRRLEVEASFSSQLLVGRLIIAPPERHCL